MYSLWFRSGKLAVIPASTIPNNCASVGNFDVRIGGSFWSWLYNILASKRSFVPRICLLISPSVIYQQKNINRFRNTCHLLKHSVTIFFFRFSSAAPERPMTFTTTHAGRIFYICTSPPPFSLHMPQPGLHRSQPGLHRSQTDLHRSQP